MFRATWAAAAVGALLALTACSSVVSGHGEPQAAPRTPGIPPSPGAARPVAPPSMSAPASSSNPAPRATSAALNALLEPAPSGARGWDTAWAANVNPTLAQFVTHDYAASSVELIESELRGQGLTTIAHRTWITSNGDQADDILLEFRTSAGASSRFLGATLAKRSVPGVKTFAVPGAADALGCYTSKLDSDGYIRTIVYAHRANIVSETFVFNLAALRKSLAVAWAKGQFSRLPR